MKGLLLKDMIVAGRQAKSSLVIVLLYLVLFRNNAPVLVGLVSMLCLMTAISSFSYDEAVKWPAYAAALPMPRRALVRAKYLLSFGLLALGVLLSAAVALIVTALTGGSQVAEVLGAALGCGLIMGFMICLTLPLMFRVPVERARVFMTLAMLIPTILVVGLAGVLPSMPQAEAVSSAPWALICVLAVAALVVIGIASYRISVRFIEKKEF